jgi:hypothetical protein
MHDAGKFRGREGQSEAATPTYALQPYGAPVDRKKGSFPWKRASKDINDAKKKRRMLDQKRQEEEEAAAKRLEIKKRKVARELAIRRIEQGKSPSSTGNMFLQSGAATKKMRETQICFKEWELPAEQEDYDGVQVVLKTYNRIFKILFQNYSGTGKSAKFKNMTDFDWLAERKKMLVMAEILKIFIDHKVIPGLIPKEEFVNLLKLFCQRVSHTVENNYLDYPNFVQFFA